MEDRDQLINQHDLLQIVMDQSEINLRLLDALHATSTFAANAGQSSTQYFLMLSKLVSFDDEQVDIPQIVENHQEMIDATKKLIAINTNLVEMITVRHDDIRKRMEAVDAGLKRFR